MSQASKVAVLGAGNGGHAMAGHLALKGVPIRLYNKFEEEIEAMREQKGVTLEGAVEGFGPLEMVSTEIEPVVSWADVIMVVVPAFAHRFMAEICAPYLHDGQTIILNPGRTAGALEFAGALREAGTKAKVKIAEAQTLVYACRLCGPARVKILSVKREVLLAALPASDTPAVLEVARALYPEFIPAGNVLETSFDNIGAVFHPSTMILNADRIEAGDDFDFYHGMTPMVAGFLEVIDDERLAVAEAYGVKVDSAREWLEKAYSGIKGETLYERIQSNDAYQGIKAPKTLRARYILEDIPKGLVPIVSFGRMAGVKTPASEGIVNVACALLQRDFWAEGRTVENLGLGGMSVPEIVSLVEGK